MKKLLTYVLSLLMAPCLALAQPSVNGPMFGPNWPSGYVPSPQQWQLLWTNKLDYYSAGLPIAYGGTGAVTANGAAANLGLLNNSLTNGRIWIGNGSNVATAALMSGDCTITNTGVMTCVSKTLANGQFWIGNGSNVATAHAMSGDCTMTNAGVVTCVLSSPLVVGTTGVSGGTTNGLLFATSGAKLGNLATANSSILATDGSGVPAYATALPSGITATTQSISDNTTKVATTAYVTAFVAAQLITIGTTGLTGSTANGILYATSGAKIGNLAVINSGVLVTDISGVPSIGTVLPNGITATTQATTDSTTAVATTAFVMTHIASVINLAKITASGTAPGAAKGKLEWVTGTVGGSCKLIAYGGTSSTPVTVLDNVGSGC